MKNPSKALDFRVFRSHPSVRSAQVKPHDGSRQELRDLDDLQPRPEAQGLEALLRRGLVHAIRHRQPLQLAVLPLQSYRTLECEQERREKGKNQLLRPEFHIISLFFSYFFFPGNLPLCGLFASFFEVSEWFFGVLTSECEAPALSS